MRLLIRSALGGAFGSYIGMLGYHLGSEAYWALLAFFVVSMMVGGL